MTTDYVICQNDVTSHEYIQVADLVFDDSTDTNCKTNLENAVKKIEFKAASDTASDGYRTAPGKLFTFDDLHHFRITFQCLILQ